MRATWFCVDIECSGPIPHRYDMISLGAVVVKEPDLELGASFYVEIAPTGPAVDPGAMAVNKLDIESLRREGRPLADALADLVAFVQRELVPGTKPVFVGHNAPFDWSFVAYYYAYAGMENPFGYNALDTKALSMGKLDLSWLETSKENLQTLLTLPPQDDERVHNAVYDARYQAEILAALLNLPKRTDLPKK